MFCLRRRTASGLADGLEILLAVGALLAISTLADGGVCFRKYSAEKKACKGRMAHEFTNADSDTCCSRRGHGYAKEVKRFGQTKKWFECIPCTSKSSEPVMMKQVAPVEPQVDDPVPAQIRLEAEDEWLQKKMKKKASKQRKTAFNQDKNAANKLDVAENSVKLPVDGSEAQVDGKTQDADDDVWSQWSDWGPCSQTCGDGLRQRTRFCLKSVCKDGDFQERPCTDLQPCAVDGMWSDWSEWSECNVTCGEGYEERTRTCNNPAPMNGGKDCQGLRAEARKCQKQLPCPVDGGWSAWANWTACSATCGEGFQTRSRQCNNPLPEHGGKPCEGLELESRPCVTRTNCAVDGNWTEWSKMDICSAKPCSGQPGYRTRFRSCTNPRPMYGGSNCKGRSWMRERCYNNDFCTEKVDGGWCKWKEWSDCKYGIQNRSRACDCPPPANDGKPCKGEDVEEKACGGVLEDMEAASTVKTSTSVTKREGCYDNEVSGDGSDVSCDQEPEEAVSTDEPGSGDSQK